MVAFLRHVRRGRPALERTAGHQQPARAQSDDRVPVGHGDELRAFSPGRRGAGRNARHRRCRAHGFYKLRDPCSPERDAYEIADAYGDPRRHRFALGGRCRLRARHPARRRHFLRGRPASAGRHRGCVCRCIGRLFRELRAVVAGPVAAGPHPGGRADPRPGHPRQSAQQLFLHDGVVGPDHRPRLVHHRQDRRTAHRRDRDRRRRRRPARDARPATERAQGPALGAGRDGHRPGSVARYCAAGSVGMAHARRRTYLIQFADDARDRLADLPAVPRARHRLRHRRRHDEEFEGHDRGHDPRDARHGVLPRHHVLHRPVRVRVRPVEPRRAAGARGRELPQGDGRAGIDHDRRHRHPDRIRQHLRRLGQRQVGAARADLRAHADVARHLARPDAGGVPRRRLEHQHHHAGR